MPEGEKGFKPGTRSRGGKRAGAGRKPRPLELLELKIAAENIGQLAALIPDALGYVAKMLTDKRVKPDKVRLEAAKIVLGKMLPDSLIERALERNMQEAGEMRESPLIKALTGKLPEVWNGHDDSPIQPEAASDSDVVAS